MSNSVDPSGLDDRFATRSGASSEDFCVNMSFVCYVLSDLPHKRALLAMNAHGLESVFPRLDQQSESSQIATTLRDASSLNSFTRVWTNKVKLVGTGALGRVGKLPIAFRLERDHEPTSLNLCMLLYARLGEAPCTLESTLERYIRSVQRVINTLACM